VIRFKPGLNVLLGRIGSGKSSILESILLCLFGFGGGTKKRDVLRTNATPDLFQMELTFFFDGVYFKVARGNETWLQQSTDGSSWALVTDKSKEIDEFIENTLGVSAKKFRDLFYAAQGELTRVVSGSPEERQKSIDKLLGAEGLRNAYDGLSEFTKFFDEEIGKAQTGLLEAKSYLSRHDLQQLKEQQAEAAAEMQRIQDRLQVLKAKISKLSREASEVSSQLQPLREAEETLVELERLVAQRKAERGSLSRQVEEFKKRIRQLEDEVKTHEQRLEEIKPKEEEIAARLEQARQRHAELSELSGRVSDISHDLGGLRQSISLLARELARQSTTAEEAGSDLAEIRSRRAELEKEKESCDDRLSKINAEIEQAEAHRRELESERSQIELERRSISDRIHDLAERIEKIKSLPKGATCPLCEQPISLEHRSTVIGRLKSEAELLYEKHQEQERRLAEKKRQIEGLDAEIDGKKNLASQVEAKSKALEIQIRTDANKEENRKRDLEQVLSRLSELERDLQDRRSSLQDLARRLEDVAKRAGLEPGEDLEAIRQKLDEQTTQVNQLQNELSTVRSKFSAEEMLLRKAEAQILQTKESLETETSRLSDVESELSRLRKSMEEVYQPLVGPGPDPLGRIRSRVQSLSERERQLTEDLNTSKIEQEKLSGRFRQLEDAASRLSQQIEEYLSEQEKARKYKKRYDVYSEAKNLLLQLRDRYLDAREMVRSDLIKVLRQTIWEEFHKLYAYEDFQDVEVSDDYEVSLIGPFGRIHAHNLSAGQKAIVSIAFRLAVAKAMDMRIGCWIIDEPTQNIGEQEVEALAEVLADTSHIPQIIVATHHEVLGRYGNVITLDMRDGETVLGHVEEKRVAGQGVLAATERKSQPEGL